MNLPETGRIVVMSPGNAALVADKLIEEGFPYLVNRVYVQTGMDDADSALVVDMDEFHRVTSIDNLRFGV